MKKHIYPNIIFTIIQDSINKYENYDGILKDER